MPRLIVLNNYSLDRVLGEVARGDKPAHHLFGIDRFAKMGFSVVNVPFVEGPRPPSYIARALRALPPLGDVRQQFSALQRICPEDLVYAPCQTQTHLLSYLRALRLLPNPLVVLAHHRIRTSKWFWNAPFLKLQLRGTDEIPCLSRVVSEEIKFLSRGLVSSEPVPWGPDLAYYPPPDGSAGEGAVAAGRTGRDFPTFALAASKAKVPAHIYCLTKDESVRRMELGALVTVTSVDHEEDLNYRTLVPPLAAARVHAIPLMPGASLSGLTSLTDALALGKPVIMTRHKLIDIDLEVEGIGRWVAPGDVAGWAEALRWFDTHPTESAEMGKRARSLAETRLNLDMFAEHMRSIFERTLDRAGRGRPAARTRRCAPQKAP